MRIDSTALEIQVSKEESFKTIIISGTKPNKAHGTFTVVETEEGVTLQGEWTTWDEFYIIFNAEYYAEGGVYIHYDVFKTQSDYLGGESPILTADYYLSPDNSGNGHLTADNKIYRIEFHQYGESTISHDGKSKMIPLYR